LKRLPPNHVRSDASGWLVGFVLALLVPVSAQAHVKWFAPYNVASAPVGLHKVLNPTFIELVVLALIIFWFVSSLERTRVGAELSRAIGAVFAGLRERTDDLIRAGTAAFFVAIWTKGGIILTPELYTTSLLTTLLQVGIAICLFWRSTMILSAIGIFVLFFQGIWSYGLFHMMDYPIFLGAAVYLGMSGLRVELLFGLRPLDIARWGTGITLMWASIEKWAYPGWSYPVLATHPQITAGLDPRFYMIAAGMLEFALAFSLLWSMLVRRAAAVVLLSMFTSAVIEFGKIDAIGHLLIIILLLAILADDQPSVRPAPVLAPVYFSAALTLTMLAYYLGHAALFATPVV